LKICRVRREAVRPCRATPGSAGLDLQAILEKAVTIEPGKRVTVPTGLAVEIPEGMAGFVFGRSGLGIRHGIVPSNAVGVIDSDYRGEILVGLSNHGDEPYTIQPGERVAQLVVMPVSLLPVEEVETLEETERSAGGFGSTGRL